MEIRVTYTVNCSHKAFEDALAKLLPKMRFHDVAWRYTENYGDDNDPDFFSTFSYPDKHHPTLTKDLFWKMAVSSLALSDHGATGVFMRVESEDKSFSVSDGWMKGQNSQESPRLRYDEKAFSSEMADRLKQIAKIACGHEPGDW